MKRFIAVLFVLQIFISSLTAQSEAGAIFLLIAPGARAGGMGEAQVACLLYTSDAADES